MYWLEWGYREDVAGAVYSHDDKHIKDADVKIAVQRTKWTEWDSKFDLYKNVFNPRQKVVSEIY